MHKPDSVTRNDRTAQQLVSYEALFKLIDEIHPLEDITDIAERVARQWKYFANVAAWRLVVRNGNAFTVMDGSRGQALVETVDLLSSWDAHFMRSRLPVLYSVSEIPESPLVPEHLIARNMTQVSVIPFVKLDSCYALLTVAARHEPFTEIDKKFIRLFSTHFANLVHGLALQRRVTDNLINRASHDFLTGMLNRETIMGRLDIFFRLAKRTGDPLSILIADIDHFKNINDTHGHLAGDRALKAVSKILMEQTRDSDHLGRYGGEEFLFVLYPCKPNRAFQAAERRRKAVEKHGIPLSDNGGPVRVTLSFGISSMTTADLSPDSLIARADAALYEAKNGGRNRCILRP